MKREFSGLLEELQDGLMAATRRARGAAALRVAEVEMRLPVDLSLMFSDGGLRLLADVPRSGSDSHWQLARSQLRLCWQAVPLPEEDAS